MGDNAMATTPVTMSEQDQPYPRPIPKIAPDIIREDGSKVWLNTRCEPHQDPESGLPAVIHPNGLMEWYCEGVLHRDLDLPAQDQPGVFRAWWFNGERHRLYDLPAIEHHDGTKMWYQYDKRHRDKDKPAIEWNDGSKWWYHLGELHRPCGGPAIECRSGYCKYVYRGNATLGWFPWLKSWLGLDTK